MHKNSKIFLFVMATFHMTACHSSSVEETNLQRAQRLEHEALCLRVANGEIAAMLEMKYKKLSCAR